MLQTLELSAQTPNPPRHAFALMASFVFVVAACGDSEIDEGDAFEESAIKLEGQF